METRQNHTFRVGIFVAAGLILFMITAVVLGGNRFAFSRKVYYFTELPEVQGLHEGSIVSIAGMTSGNVSRLEFKANSNEVRVHFYINQEIASRITNGSQIALKTQGALGDKFLFLTPGPIDAPQIAPNSGIPAEKSRDLFEVLGSQGDTFANLGGLISEAKIMLEQLNEGQRAGKLIDRMDDSMMKLASVLADLERTSQALRGESKSSELSETIKSLRSVVTKLDSGKGTLASLINDSVLYEQILNLVGKPQRASYLKPLIRQSIQSAEESGK